MYINYNNIEIKLDNKVYSDAWSQFRNEFNHPLTYIPFDQNIINAYKSSIENIRNDFENIVVLGVGGSDLGSRALFRALKHQYHNQISNRKLYFAGDTTDPVALNELLDVINFGRTLFIVISKSGTTVETTLTFIFIRKVLIEKLGFEEHKKHILVITDPKEGHMRSIVNKNGYLSIDHPDVGGRFSVLTAVGMAPLYAIDVNIDDILKGAMDMKELIIKSNIQEDIALQYAAAHNDYFKKGFNIAVIMPYLYSLKEFGAWFRQLWAESLGKALDNNGQKVNTGSTPVAALGPVDQHSQLQLFNEGPYDKLITFISAKNFAKDITIDTNFENIEELEYLQNHKLSEVLNNELLTTSYALNTNNRPNMTIEIEVLNEYQIGQLIYFFEMVVVYMGYLWNINPFDQPGVELSKNAMYGVLGRNGFEKPESI